jgi:hypothetical protein
MRGVILCSVIAVAASAGLPTNARADVLYGISNGFGTATDNTIYQIDPFSGAVSNVHQVSLPGFTVANSQALAANPLDSSLWAVIQTSDNTRRLVSINPSTGVATQAGTLSNKIATLAFRADGSLLGVSGDGGSPSETLYQISTVDGTLTPLFALGNGDDGESIAMGPTGLMYHSSGNSTALFESVDLNTQVVTPLGSASGEAFAMGYSSSIGALFLSVIDSDLFRVDVSTGARTLVGNIPSVNDNRGLAFVVPAPGAAALLGLGALAGARRRRR